MWNPFRTPPLPSPLQIAVEDLEQTKRDKLKASWQREHFSSLEDMLTHRIMRLSQDILCLSQDGTKP